jgi:hypothetical protein
VQEPPQGGAATDVRRRGSQRFWHRGWRYRYRLVAAMLLVSVPLMVGLAVLLTSASSADLTKSAEAKGGSTARSVTLHLEDWLGERQHQLRFISLEVSGQLRSAETQRLLRGLTQSSADYSHVEVTDLTGKVVSASSPGGGFPTQGEEWFRTARSGRTALTSLEPHGNRLQWILARPVVGANGETEGVIAADLNAAQLGV